MSIVLRKKEKLNHRVQLARAIELSGLSQADFARQIGVTPDTIFKWRKRNFVPEKHRGAIQKATHGGVKAAEFDPAYAVD